MPYPNLYIVGAAKCGTTSLHHYLGQHPDIFMSTHKEPHYFADIKPTPDLAHMIRRVADESGYLSLFAGAGEARIVGEASPSYLWDAGAARRIHNKRPDAKIVILLRDPIDRAYSHYLMDVREGLQETPFLEALQRDMAIPDKSWGSGEGHMYVELGQYTRQVGTYLETFGRSQVFIGMFADLKKDPKAFTAAVLGFLGVSRQGLEQIDFSQEHNVYAAPRSGLSRLVMAQGWLRRLAQKCLPAGARRLFKDLFILRKSAKPELAPEAVALLAPIYGPELVELERLLGRDLPELWGGWRSFYRPDK